MLVYSSNFLFAPKEGPKQIIDLIARWMRQRSRGPMSAAELARGVSRKRLKDGSLVTSRATKDGPDGIDYPYMFSAELSHGDDQVSGRLWSTGIGVRQISADAPVECTFLLKTDEASARVLSPIQVTRPRIVSDVVDNCNPVGETPGLSVKKLDVSSARAFLSEVEREGRSFPIVVISPLRDGNYLVRAERLRSLLVGVADVVQIDPSVNTFEIENILGRRYGAWGGAINVIYRARQGGSGTYCDSSLYLPDRLIDLAEAGVNLDSEILSNVTHQTNVPASWRHISLGVVDQAIFKAKLAFALTQAKNSDDSASYVALLEQAMDQLGEKDATIIALRDEVQSGEERIMELQASVQSLKYSLAGQRNSAIGPDDEGLEAIQPLREAVSTLVAGDPTLEQSLTVIRTLFPDRVVVLDSAVSSARDSESFRQGKKAFELLWKLVTSYWDALAGGRGDAEGRKAFGQNAYAQNEANALSTDGRRRRTFDYKGQDILMERHLKIGTKDSVAETLRVHFEWVGADRVLVIGHCGKHLDF